MHWREEYQTLNQQSSFRRSTIGPSVLQETPGPPEEGWGPSVEYLMCSDSILFLYDVSFLSASDGYLKGGLWIFSHTQHNSKSIRAAIAGPRAGRIVGTVTNGSPNLG